MLASSPCAASACRTIPAFQPATNPSVACCTAQPPQAVKCGQGGATRSGEGSSTRQLPSVRGSTLSPGSTRGMSLPSASRPIP